MNLQEAALRGRVLLKLQTRDGQEIEVSLRLIKIPEIGTYLDVALDDFKSLAMTVESPENFDPSILTDESFTTLLDADEALNFIRALAMKKAEMLRAERRGQGVKGIYQCMASLLAKYAPPSPSEEVSPETKSTT